MKIPAIAYIGVSLFMILFTMFIANISEKEQSKFMMFYIAAAVFFVIGIIRFFSPEPVVGKLKHSKPINHPNNLKAYHINHHGYTGHTQHNTSSYLQGHHKRKNSIKQCSRCGAVLHHNANFCQSCGYAFYRHS